MIDHTNIQPMDTQEEIHYPSIIFKVSNTLYCINSKYVDSILSLPEYEKVPNAPENIVGVFSYRGKMIQILDLRTMLGKISLKNECNTFQQMIDARKQDHINWVNELERTIRSGESFTLTNDPHKCALGKWYDHFTCDDKTIMFYLKKMEEPHRLLHATIDEIERSKSILDENKRAKVQEDILQNARNVYMPKVLQALEKAASAYQATLDQSIVLVLMEGEYRIGVLIDAVLAVEMFISSNVQEAFQSIPKSPLILGIGKGEKIEEDILEVNAPNLISSVLHKAEQLETVSERSI